MIRIIGCGNALRRDDGAGLAVARRLKAAGLPGAEVQMASGEGTDLFERLQGAEQAIVIDAMRSGLAPGTIRLFEPDDRLDPDGFGSSHSLGLAHAIELSRFLGVLPRRLEVYGIEGRDFRPGPGLSPPVEKAVRRLAKRLYQRCTNAGS